MTAARGRVVVPPLLIVVLTVVVWMAGGVATTDTLLHLAYLALVVVGPGALLVRLLTGARDPIVVLGIGFATGMALEVLGVALTSNLDLRWLAPAVPAAIAAAAWWAMGGIGSRDRTAGGRRSAWSGSRPAPKVALAVAFTVGAVLLLCAGWLFPSTPLPGTASPSVTYEPDTLFYLGISADALHHWPPANPSIAGQHLPYHVWAFAREAGEARATGIDLPVVAFRLDTTTTAIALALAIAALARTAGAGALGTGLAALLPIAAGELDLDPHNPFPFRGSLLAEVATDPSTGVGLVMFTAAATALWHVVCDPRHRGGLVLAALLLFGAVGAKIPAVPVLLGGTVLLGTWQLLVCRRRPPLGLVMAATMAITTLALGLLFLYSGNDNSTLRLALAPLKAFEEMDLIRALRASGDAGAIPGYGALPDMLRTGLLAFGGVVGLAAAQFAGATLGPWRDVVGSAPDGWLAALTLSGGLPFLLLTLDGDEVYFVHYALLTGSVLAAVRFERYAWQVAGHAGRLRLAAAAGGAMAIGLATAWWIGGRGPEVGSSVLPTLSAVGLALILAVGLLMVRHSGTHVGGAGAATLACAALLGLALLDGVLDTVPPVAEAGEGNVLYGTDGRGLNDELLAGLHWVRENTAERSVIAVNNHFVDDDEFDPRAFQYSAFSERRVYFQSWRYTLGASRVGDHSVTEGVQPYPELAHTNSAAFAGDTDALRALRRAGVTHLVLDRRYGQTPDRLSRISRTVFSNPSVTVFAIPASDRATR